MNKLRWKIQRFLQGRNGADQLSQAAVIMGLVFYFIFLFTRKSVFNWISTIALVYAMFRVLSKNLSARAELYATGAAGKDEVGTEKDPQSIHVQTMWKDHPRAEGKG